MYIVHVTSALTSFQYLQGNNLLNIAERNYIFWSPCPHVCRRHTFFISQILRTTSNDHQRITNSPPPFCSAHVDRDIKAKNQALPSLYLKVSSFDRLEMIEMSIQYSLEEPPPPQVSKTSTDHHLKAFPTFCCLKLMLVFNASQLFQS